MEVKYFKNCKNPAEIAERFQTISRVFDFNGSPAVTPLQKEIESEREQVLSAHQAIQQGSSEPPEESLEGIVGKIKSYGLSGEVCGRWLWLSGQNVHSYRDQLRSMGFQFSRSKKAWYWRHSEDRSLNENPVPLEAIRQKYGSKTISANA